MLGSRLQKYMYKGESCSVNFTVKLSNIKFLKLSLRYSQGKN